MSAINNNKNLIKKGGITNYTVLDDINYNTFENIFNHLQYTGFASSDFIIKDNKIIIFEINPRLGGSLVHNKLFINKFINILVKKIENISVI
jgi:predicted ATP-grasp superfamily ATP-dependent carboligase